MVGDLCVCQRLVSVSVCCVRWTNLLSLGSVQRIKDDFETRTTLWHVVLFASCGLPPFAMRMEPSPDVPESVNRDLLSAVVDRICPPVWANLYHDDPKIRLSVSHGASLVHPSAAPRVLMSLMEWLRAPTTDKVQREKKTRPGSPIRAEIARILRYACVCFRGGVDVRICWVGHHVSFSFSVSLSLCLAVSLTVGEWVKCPQPPVPVQAVCQADPRGCAAVEGLPVVHAGDGQPVLHR